MGIGLENRGFYEILGEFCAVLYGICGLLGRGWEPVADRGGFL